MGITVTENKNEIVKKGEILFVQGQNCNSINYLIDGEVEILTTTEVNVVDADEIDIVENSKTVCTLQKNTFFGIDSVLTGQPYSYSIKAITDCTVNVYKIEKGQVAGIFAKLNNGMLMARSLLKLQQKSLQRIMALDNFIKDIQRMEDNLALVYRNFAKAYDVTSTSTLASFAHSLSDTFTEAGGSLPIPLTTAVLKTSFEKTLNKKYGYENNLEKRKLNFLYKFFSAPTDLQLKLFEYDVSLLIYIAQELAGEIGNIMGEIDRAYNTFKKEFTHFTSEKDNWMIEFGKLLIAARKKNIPDDIKIISDIVSYLINVVMSVDEKFFNEFNFKISAPEKVIMQIKNLLENKESAGVGKVEVEEEDLSEIPEEAKDQLTKILDFSEIEPDPRKQIIKGISDFKRVSDRLSADPDVRKIRKSLTNLYWQLYKKVFLKAYKSNAMNRNVELFLTYGFLDEGLLKNSQVNSVWKFKDKPTSKYSVYYITEWLEKIYKKEFEPSVNELGQTFIEIMREKFKVDGKKSKELPEEIDTGESRAAHEIENMIPQTVKLTSGNLQTAFPILMKEQIWRNIDDIRVTRARICKTIDDILERDFSLFHREVLYKNPERNIVKEFILRQVIPNFIIVPSSGSKIMMWQDLDGRSKSSQGRFAIPAFATDPANTSQYDDLFLLLLRSFGVFRWELIKTILGPSWNDVTESSITADYTDYVQFFKKNPRLSPETKEKLSAEFKRFRSDRDRFVNDYFQWILFEYEGLLKLNTVAREIMFKHVPFKKEVREKLGSVPAFIDIFTKFKNITSRKMKETENRYFKYTKSGDPLPDELQQNLDFYKV